MANEFKHITKGTSLTQAEFEHIDLHALNSQATGDLIYASSATQLTRLGIGATNTILTVIGGVPTWQTTLSGLTFVAPALGAATATSINGLIITTTAGTLTIANNASAALVTSGNYSITLTATGATNITLPTTGTLATLTGVEALTNKTITLGGTVTGGANILSNLGMVYIGDTANTKQTLGLTINQGAADNEALSFKSSDVTHTMTGVAEADTYGRLQKASATAGGLEIAGFSSSEIGINLDPIATTLNTTKTTGADGIMGIAAYENDGAGSVRTPATADTNLVVIKAGGSTARFIFDLEGSGHADVGWVTYAKHDDLALVKDMEQELLLREDNAQTARRHILEEIGIIGKNSWHMESDKPRAMINFTKLAMLHHGALLQLNTRLDQQVQELTQLKQSLKLLLN